MQYIRFDQLFCKNTTFTVFVDYQNKTVNFTRSCAFAQKTLILRVTNVKKQNLTHPKAAKLATLSQFMHKIIILP